MARAKAYASGLVSGGKTPGCVIGAVEGGTAQCMSFGHSRVEPPVEWADDTLFGLDSVTKVFTAIMFADAVIGGLAESDPIDSYLPPGTQLKPCIRNKITLLMLANYTSQFPDYPSNEPRKDGRRDPSVYTIEEFKQYLEDDFDPPPGKIGTSYLYSSLAFGLLGYILVNYYDLNDYQALVTERLTNPGLLDMPDTVAQLSPAQAARLAVGYQNGNPQPPLQPPPFLGGGGVLRSTGADMLRFLNALITASAPGSLPQAFAKTQAETFFMPDHPGHGIGLGWFLWDAATQHWCAKNGGGSGFSAQIAFVPDRQAGLFAACNEEGVDFEPEFARLLGMGPA